MNKKQEEKKVDLRPVVVIEKMEFESGLVTYKVPSNSTPGEFHYVTFDGDEIVSCTCLGYRNYAHCYVSSELKERVGNTVKNDESFLTKIHSEHTPEASQEELPIETPVIRKYNIYKRVTGEFVTVASGESAYDAINEWGLKNGYEKPIDRFYAEIILFEKQEDELPIEQKGALHSSRPFSLMR